MEQVYRIRNMKKFEGKSLRKIAEITGHDFETVKKYVEKDDFNIGLKIKRRRIGKLSKYEETVRTWLLNDKHSPHKQQHTAKRVYDRLKEKYDPEFNVSDRAVRKLVAGIRKDIEMNSDGYIPLEHPPGEAQADFGEARFVENGITYDGHYLNLSYPYSNGGHAQLFKSWNQECLFEGLKAIFEHIGGVPTAIWFDNMSTAVKKIRSYGERDLTDGFLRFMMHYGFASNFCNPDSGHEKGSVENKVGYHRRNMFVPVPEFNDLRGYNKELLSRCDLDMNRGHYKGIGMINELFIGDRQEFFKLPTVPFEAFTQKFAKADKYGKVKFDGKIYSASPTVAGSEVIVKAGAYDVEIFDTSLRRIAAHKRLYGEIMESMDWIPYLEILSKRPAAIKYTGLFDKLPPSLKEYLNDCGYEMKKQLLKLFTKMALMSGIDTAAKTLDSCLEIGAADPDSIWALHCRLISNNQTIPELSLSDSVPELKKYTPDISVYDRLIVAGGRLS